ncbi:hypothetical protein SAMN03159443_04699 [Pseudomonas sp. NFACC15-1]|nr:hypothetical protein SAMN03159443_04699 [Pseudomonas sp. NFACC15-1]SDY71670.1 hypothetical protein SAMN03159380_04569 [Pseudomonas sp. NFACC14]
MYCPQGGVLNRCDSPSKTIMKICNRDLVRSSDQVSGMAIEIAFERRAKLII